MHTLKPLEGPLHYSLITLLYDMSNMLHCLNKVGECSNSFNLTLNMSIKNVLLSVNKHIYQLELMRKSAENIADTDQSTHFSTLPFEFLWGKTTHHR